MAKDNYLFSAIGWSSVDGNQRTKLAKEVEQLDGNRLLNTAVEDLCAYLTDKYSVDVPVLDRDGIVADQREKQIELTGELDLFFADDRSQPVRVTGTEIEITVPFTGEADAFGIQPTTHSSGLPEAHIEHDTLVLSITGRHLQAEQVRQEVDGRLDSIDGFLANLRRDAEILNNELGSFARERVEQRRQKLLANQNLVADLGFNLKQRDDAPTTYVAPQVRRKIKATLPPASSLPYKPEPILAPADYGHILKVIENMAQVMERSPSAFTTMDEQSLRFHFLVQLNGHYEGQATGETFNYEGKTDILIRSEGKNIFIAECKYWDGAKIHTQTIDQLLGYTSWRDTKVAVIVFNRNKDFTKVLESIRTTTNDHPNCKRDLGENSESSFSFIFSHRGDENRELTLTIMAFDVPNEAKAQA